MDFDFYRNFVVVAEMGNISAAAKRLSIVQPALSAQIKTLEKYYNIQLFKTSRGKRHIELTEAGEAFLQQARQMCATEDDINLTMQSFSKQASGTLRFSVSHVRSQDFLEQYVIPFAKDNPQITFQFHEATVATQMKQLYKGLVDFAFSNAPIPHSEDIITLQVATESIYAFYHKEIPVPWTENNAITPSQLENLPICCNYGSYGLLRSVCREYGVQPKVAFIATTASNALIFAAQTHTLAVIAALEDDIVPPDVIRVPINDIKLAFPQSLYWSTRHSLSPAAKLFLEHFKNNLSATSK